MADIPYDLVADGWSDGAAAVREFGSALEDAGSEADEFAKSADHASSGASDFGESLDVLKGIAGTVGGALAAATTAALAWGASVERTVGVFNALPGSLTAAQQAVGGLVSEMDLAVSRNRLMSAGLELTDQQFADVAEVATHYAQTIGGDTTEAMEQFGDALQGLSADELARFGLSIDASKSRSQQFAEAMEQLHARAAEMETGTQSLGGAWQRLTVILEDAVTEAQRATDIVSQQITSFDDLARAITGSADATLTWRDVSQTTEDIFVSFIAAVGAGVETMNVAVARAISGWRSFFDFLREGFHEIASGNLDFGAAFQRSLRNFQQVRGDESLADIFSNALTRNLDAIVQNPAGGSVPAPSGGLRGGPRSGGSSAEVDHRTTEERIDDMLGAQQAAEAAQRAMEDEQRAARIALSETRNALDAWSQGLDKAAEASRLAREEQQRLVEQQKELNDAARDAAAAFRDSWRQGVDAVIEALNEANDAARKAGTAQVSAMEAAGQAALAASAQMGDALLGGVANAFAGAVKAAVTGEKSFGEALAGMLEDTLFSIGTQAVVMSVFEFARAIGDAASLNAAGAAAHAAAGAAYAAVAALAFAGGAGLAAANAGAGAGAGAGGGAGVSTPSNPQPANDNGSSGGTTIINVTFGGQVVTASTHAELGRQVKSAVGQADARWGRAG